MREQIRELIYEVLMEFKEDIGKQCVVLMGLPAAGKSTFINDEAAKYIPGFSGYKVTNSDVQVMAAQHQTATNHYNWLKKNIKSPVDITKFIESSQYVDNNGSIVRIPLTFDWWEVNESKGIKNFYRVFYKPYYATYFDIRDLAQAKEKQLFQTKVVTAGNILIIDTVGSKSAKILERLQKTREHNYTNTIIYLEINVDLALQRDVWRKDHSGRGVGIPVIVNYSKSMDNAYNDYKAEGTKENGVVDRLMHFVWKPAGNSPVKGTWTLTKDDRFSLKRRLKSLKGK